MANTVTIGRLTFTSPGNLTYTGGGSERNYTLAGVIVPTDSDGLDLTEAKYIRDELISMANYDIVYPFTYAGDTTISAYVKVESADVTINRYAGAGIAYNISLKFLGNPGEIRFESQFSGGILDNDHSITSTDSQFFAPPVGAYSIHLDRDWET